MMKKLTTYYSEPFNLVLDKDVTSLNFLGGGEGCQRLSCEPLYACNMLFSNSSFPMVLGPESYPAEVYRTTAFCHAKRQVFKVLGLVTPTTP